MTQLPYIQAPDQTLNLLQTRWRSILNPVLGIPLLSGNFIKNVSLIVGSTNINHELMRVQQGYIITDQQGAANIYRSQPFNTISLNLSSNAAVTISLWCF